MKNSRAWSDFAEHIGILAPGPLDIPPSVSRRGNRGCGCPASQFANFVAPDTNRALIGVVAQRGRNGRIAETSVEGSLQARVRS